MSSIREQLADAVVAKLNADLPGGMSEFLDTPPEEPDANSGCVFQGPDQIEPADGPIAGPRQLFRVPKALVKRRLWLHVECRATGDESTPARKAVEQRVVYVEKKLAGEKWGGLAIDTYINQINSKFVSAEAPHQLSIVEIVIDYVTLTTDPEQQRRAS